MSAGMPAMQSMVVTGAPTYAAAPTMTSMYATPGASMYMPASQYAAAPATYAAPMVETVGAPQVQYVTTQAPSYVAAPAMVEYAAPVAQFMVPAPVSLTQGMTEPAKLDAERVAYEKALAAQLKKQSDATMQEASIKKQMLEQTAKKNLAEYQLQIEEQLKMSCLQVDQEAQNMINGLKEAAITQQTAREENAAIAVADYNKKKALEDMAVKSYQLQKTWYDNEMRLTAEYQKVMKAGSQSVITPSLPVAPVGGMI